MTRRLLALLLALLLPLQLSWAAVGEMCQHESSPTAAQHFGHHAHVHQADGKKSDGTSAFDNDCGYCHAGAPVGTAASESHVPALPSCSKPVAVVQPDHPSALARAPDRPQWLRLA